MRGILIPSIYLENDKEQWEHVAETNMRIA